MEAAAASVGKAALNALLSGAKSAIAEESALTQAVQRDMVFLADELEEMQSVLRDVVQSRDYRKVPRSRVKQLRSLAYDVEDCLQEYSVHLEKPSGWRLPRTVLERHRIAADMKGLRARVEDMNQRNLHHQLMHNAGSKPANEQSGQFNISAARIHEGTSGCLGEQASSSSIIPGATMFGIKEARRQKDKEKVDLPQLINEGNKDLRVIAVWGTGGVLDQTVVIKGTYDNLKRSKMFELYAWIRIVHPFNPLEFLQCIMMQFYQISFQETGETQGKANIGVQVLKKMGMIKQDDLVDAFSEHVNEKRYLIVLNDLSTIEEWDSIKEYFPDNNKGSRIIVSTEHGEVASLCAGQESTVSELNQSSVDQSIFASYNKASQKHTTLMEPGSSSSETTLGTNGSVMVMPTDDILEHEFVGGNEKIVRKRSLTLLRTMACASAESHLVGREKEKSDLINLISKQDDQQLLVISVWGMGGVGKTTLVKEIYQSQELSGLFEKRAYVTITRPFVLQDVLESLYMQLDAESYNRKGNDVGPRRRKVTENEATIGEFDGLLQGKRCLIVLDDISSRGEWGMIIQCLPKMNSMCRIVITTRQEHIARHCSQKRENTYKLHVLEDWDALDLFITKVFSGAKFLEWYNGGWYDTTSLLEEARKILKKCGGLPLAIVTIGGLLQNHPKTPIEWRKMNEDISAELEMNPELGTIRNILMKAYDGLPYHLKYCFLYMSIFPKDYSISRRRLVHRWKAEGYSSNKVRGWSMEEIVDFYFMGLINRSMVLPSKESIGSRKGISSCKLHDLMHEISISMATEENLVFRMEEGCSLYTQCTMRHLVISSNWEGNQDEFECIVDLSRIRSLTVFGKWKPFYISDKMKLLRVLDLESTSGLVDHHIEPIGKLLHLKYLSLRECDGIFHLPESLGNLKQLETLDVTNTRIMKLPQTITKLRKLQHILAGNVSNRIVGSSSYEEWVKSKPKRKRNKLCIWTSILIAFCISSCSLEFAKSVMDREHEDPTNRRDVCTFFCCAVFPIFARLADPLGVAVPRGLRKLIALHTLGTVNIAPGKAILKEIKMLTRLRKLAVTGINKKNSQEFCSTLAHLSSLESLSVHSVLVEGLRDCLDSLHTPPKNLQSLKLYGALGKLPEWVAGLRNLVKLKLEHTELTELYDTIEVLGSLPNLAILRLLMYSFKEEKHCYFTRQAAFPCLTALELCYPIGPVQFEEGTSPKLEILLCQDAVAFSGLSSLPSLKEVVLGRWYDPRVEWLADMRAQLSKNPNKPVLKFIN